MRRPNLLSLAAIAIPFLSLTGCLDSSGGGEPSAAPVGDSSAPLAQRINSGTRALIPNKPGKNWVFDAYVSTDSPDVAWSRSWTKKIDFSGVAWDNPRSLTLISPRHALMAKHYQRRPGSMVIFHDRKGDEVPRAIVGIAGIAGTDLAVVLLHDDAPKNVKAYRVLEPSDSYNESLTGALVLVTDKQRLVHIHEIRTVIGRSIVFKKAEGIAEGFYEPLITGDSGNPSFVWLRGEPVLVETHTTGGPGAGPFVSEPTTFAAINQAMSALSLSGDAPVYQLQTVGTR
jgi:hypothetical protein